MGDNSGPTWKLSLTPQWGMGFLTDGKLFNFKSPYPQDATHYLGLETSLHHRVMPGSFGLLYLRGKSEDHFDPSDLPLGDDPLLNLVNFDLERKASTHLLAAQYRWEGMKPALITDRLQLFQPALSVGLGLSFARASVKDGDLPVVQVQDLSAIAMASAKMKIFSVKLGRVQFGFESSIRFFAGGTLGVLADIGMEISFPR